MKLVEGWKNAWRWFSVQAGALVVALPAAWVVLPEDVKGNIPDTWLPWIVGAVGIAVVAGRMVDQT